MKWVTNDPYVQAALAVKCPGDHVHEIVEGKNTKPSQVYLDKLAMAICGAVQDVPRESQSTRFCKVTQVDRFPWASSSAELQLNPPVSKVLATQHQDYLRDGESWMEVLADVQDIHRGPPMTVLHH